MPQEFYLGRLFLGLTKSDSPIVTIISLNASMMRSTHCDTDSRFFYPSTQLSSFSLASICLRDVFISSAGDFSPSPRDTPEQDPPPARTEDQSRERVSAYDLMVVDDDLEGLNKKKEEMHTILDQILEKASSVLEFSLKWEEIDEQFGFLKQRAIEAELKEASLREQTLELEKKEERLKLVQEREMKIEASLIERMSEEKENESDLKLFLEADVMSLVLQMQNEEVVVAHLNAQEKLLGLLQDSMLKKHEEVMRELEASKKEVSLLSKSVDDKSCDKDCVIPHLRLLLPTLGGLCIRIHLKSTVDIKQLCRISVHNPETEIKPHAEQRREDSETRVMGSESPKR